MVSRHNIGMLNCALVWEKVCPPSGANPRLSNRSRSLGVGEGSVDEALRPGVCSSSLVLVDLPL